jgi:uncharacterized protein (DUF486 family)
MRGLSTVLLLVASNAFMTLAWYGHLKFNTMKSFGTLPLLAVIGISWGIAFFEYCLMVPANRIGFLGDGGPFSLIQLKLIQEVVSLSVFAVFVLLVFRNETFRWNHLAAALCLILAVWFVFKK